MKSCEIKMSATVALTAHFDFTTFYTLCEILIIASSGLAMNIMLNFQETGLVIVYSLKMFKFHTLIFCCLLNLTSSR